MKRNVTLWVIQGLLAALFLFAGSMKLILPIEAMAGPVSLPGWFLRFIGVAEVAGAIGLILPWLTRIRPRLTPVAASGLVIIMSGATVDHGDRRPGGDGGGAVRGRPARGHGGLRALADPLRSVVVVEEEQIVVTRRRDARRPGGQGYLGQVPHLVQHHVGGQPPAAHRHRARPGS